MIANLTISFEIIICLHFITHQIYNLYHNALGWNIFKLFRIEAKLKISKQYNIAFVTLKTEKFRISTCVYINITMHISIWNNSVISLKVVIAHFDIKWIEFSLPLNVPYFTIWQWCFISAWWHDFDVPILKFFVLIY